VSNAAERDAADIDALGGDGRRAYANANVRPILLRRRGPM
jgi:hypothetical protein